MTRHIAIPYLRFSSGKQAHGTSYERQQQMIAEWLRLHPEYQLSTMTFEDLGISGWSGEHLDYGFGKLIAAIKEKHISAGSVVLVEAIDRIGRLQPLEMITHLSDILLNGVNIITLDDGVEYTKESINGAHLFLLAAKVQQANLFSENLSRRVTASWDAKRRQADRGEPVKRRLPVWINSDNTLNQDIAPIIVEIFELYASGFGTRRIQHRIKLRCQEKGINIKISNAGIQHWISMKLAIGYWNDIPNVHPAIVTEELWWRAQKERERRSKGKKLSAPTKHPLAGIVVCGVCGCTYRVKAETGKSKVMHCSRRDELDNRNCSNKKAIPIAVLETVRMMTGLDYIEKAILSTQPSVNTTRLAEIDQKLSALHSQLKSLADTIVSVGALPEIVAKAGELKYERESLELEQTILLQQTDTTDIHSVVKAEATLLLDDPLRLNALLQKVGYRISVFPDATLKVDDQSFRYAGYERKTDRFKLIDLMVEVGQLIYVNKDEKEKVARLKSVANTTKESSPLMALMKRRNAYISKTETLQGE